MLIDITYQWLNSKLKPGQMHLFPGLIKIDGVNGFISLIFRGNKVEVFVDTERYENVLINKLDPADPAYFDNLDGQLVHLLAV